MPASRFALAILLAMLPASRHVLFTRRCHIAEARRLKVHACLFARRCSMSRLPFWRLILLRVFDAA